MILMVFTVLDVKAAAYLPPFFMRQKSEALRAFSDLVNDVEHPFGKHPEDYILYHIGNFDDGRGELVPYKMHGVVAKGAELLRHSPMPLFPDDERLRPGFHDRFEQEAG